MRVWEHFADDQRLEESAKKKDPSKKGSRQCAACIWFINFPESNRFEVRVYVSGIEWHTVLVMILGAFRRELFEGSPLPALVGATWREPPLRSGPARAWLASEEQGCPCRSRRRSQCRQPTRSPRPLAVSGSPARSHPSCASRSGTGSGGAGLPNTAPPPRPGGSGTGRT